MGTRLALTMVGWRRARVLFQMFTRVDWLMSQRNARARFLQGAVMEQSGSDEGVQNVVQRVTRIEQSLPTAATKDDLAAAIAPLATKAELAAAIAPLATKAELAAAIAPLATKAELAAAIAPLATKAEMREEGAATRRHFDVVAEGLRSEIRLVAEAVTGNHEALQAVRTELKGDIAQLDRRVTRLEASQTRRR